MTIEIKDEITKVWGLFSEVGYYHLFELPADHELRGSLPGTNFQVTVCSANTVLKFPLSTIESVTVHQR